MNLDQLQGLKDLYPKLRTRSGKQIITTLWEGKLTKDGLAVTVKTVFPPSNRRRTELVVTGIADTLYVRPLEPVGLADAERFSELARGHFQRTEGGMAPLKLIKDDDGRWAFVVAKGEVKIRAPYVTRAASSAPPSASVAAKPASEKGAS